MATFTIDLLTGSVYLFSGNFNGSGSTPTTGSTYPQVNTYADLPTPASSYSGEIYIVRTGTGSYVLNRKDAGMYLSISNTWRNLGDTPAYFTSNHFQIIDGVDTAKGITFDVSGITTNVFRKVKVQNSDGTIAYLTDLNTKVDKSVFADYTGTTAPATYLTKTVFNTFTGTTLPANYYNKSQVNSLISGFTTGNTFIASGATKIKVNGDIVTIYSPTGSTGISSWTTLTDKPQWLSGVTKSEFQTGHTHSYNNLTNKLIPGTGISIIENVISATGGSSGGTTNSTLQLIDSVGSVNVNTINATPIVWYTQEFTGTSLNFTGGSRIYIQATGAYEISYVLNVNNDTGSAKNIGTVIRKDGNTDITPMSTSSLSFDLANDSSSNIMPPYLVSLAAGNYIELMAFRIGTTGNAFTKENSSWIRIKKT